jgi:pimeloyl-ACP methyl ester carboxylesterase
MFSAGRAGVRLGAMVSPQRTARHVARRFFTTERAAPERRRFTAEPPQVVTQHHADGAVTTYRWGDPQRMPAVLLVHGWNGWAQQLERFVEPLRARGFAVLAFDHVAHGASPGEAASLPIMIRTVRALLQSLPQPAGIIGHSLGAAAAAAVLVDEPAAAGAAVLIAAPTDPRPYLRWVARQLGAPDDLLDEVQREAETVAGVPMAALVADEALARRLVTPLLVVHDTADAEVTIGNGLVYAKAPRARMLTTDGLGHRRILRDPHVVESAVRFVAEQANALPQRELGMRSITGLRSLQPMPVERAEPVERVERVEPVVGREHREMLADVGAMA